MRTLTTRDVRLQNRRFVESLQTAKALEQDLKDFYDNIQTEMVQLNIQSIKGDWGSLSIATRKNWQDNGLPPRFYKRVLDTTKLNHLLKAGEKLPKLATFTESQYLVRRVK